MSRWHRDKKRFASAIVNVPKDGLDTEEGERIVRLIVESEYRRWPHLVLAVAFGIFAFLAALLHVNDPQGVELSFDSLFTARGGLATGFVALAAWAMYVGKPNVIIKLD